MKNMNVLFVMFDYCWWWFKGAHCDCSFHFNMRKERDGWYDSWSHGRAEIKVEKIIFPQFNYCLLLQM